MKEFKVLFFVILIISACTRNPSQNSKQTVSLESDTIAVDSSLFEIKDSIVDTFDSSYPLYNINSLGFDEFYTEFIPLSEELLSGVEPKDLLLPSSFFGADAKVDLDTIYTLKGKYRSSALKFAGVEETDTVYIYNFNQNRTYSCLVAQLPLIAFLNPYGAYAPVSKNDYMFGLDVQGINGRATKNYTEQEIASIHSACPFISGGAQAIKWMEIDSTEYPVRLKQKMKVYVPDRCFTFQYEDLSYFSRTFTFNGQTQGMNIGVMRNGEVIFTAQSISGEGSEPILPMLSEAPVFNNWTGRLFKGFPPFIYSLESFSFGCQQVYFIQKEPLRKYVMCDNRH